MTSVDRRWTQGRSPALLGSFGLHVGLFAIVLLLARAPMMPMGNAVAINIVAGPPKAAAPAEVPAPQPVEATAPPAAVAPSAPEKSLAPPPKPLPTPRKLLPPPPRPTPNLDDRSFLDRLQATVDKAKRSTPAHPPAARAGPVQPRSGPPGHAAADTGVSASAMQGLQQLLGRLWNVNCATEGADTVKLRVHFTVWTDGRIAGPVTAGGAEASANPLIYAAARRAIDAVHQAEPYEEAYQGRSITVNFDAHNTCSQR